MSATFYKEITIPVGFSIEQAHDELVKKEKELHQLCFCDFNGESITSEMSLDDCYIAVVGCPKAEYNDILVSMDNEYKQEKIAFEARKPQLLKEYTERAQKFLKPEEMELFNKILSIRMDDIYQGTDVEDMLDIIEALIENKDDPDKAIAVTREMFFSQQHSGASASLVAVLVRQFSPVLKDEFFNKVYKEND